MTPENVQTMAVPIGLHKNRDHHIVFPEMIGPVLSDLAENSKSKVGYLSGMNRDNFYKEYHTAVYSSRHKAGP